MLEGKVPIYGYLFKSYYYFTLIESKYEFKRVKADFICVDFLETISPFLLLP